jgi:chaperone required for assembly of F1-ATPase
MSAVKRFWTDVTNEEAEQDGVEGRVILLDGKPMRLPGGNVLCIPSFALAQAVAEEWRVAGGGKGGEVGLEAMPLTRLAGTAQTRIAPDPGPTVDALARYAENDLLCYRATHPAALVHRQARAWQPWLDWAALTFDAPLKVTSGIVHVPQSRHALRALHAAVAAFDPLVLAGLGILVPILGSLVLGLAVAEGGLDAASAHELGALDEIFQAELWGRDAEAEKRLAAVAVDIGVAARFVALARADSAR